MSDEETKSQSNINDSVIVHSSKNGFRAKGNKSGTQRNAGKGPSPEWVEAFAALSAATLFLMARQGPTVFIVKDENDGVFKVTCFGRNNNTIDCANIGGFRATP